MKQAAQQTGLGEHTVGRSLRHSSNMIAASLAKLLRFLCATIAVAGLSARETAELLDKALHLSKLNRIEIAAQEVLKDPELRQELDSEQYDMLRNVMKIKCKSLGRQRLRR